MSEFETLRNRTDGVTYLVGHRHPDDDVWLCCWMAKKFVPACKNAQIVFVNAGERLLPEADEDTSVLHFDTGGGDFDQHGKSLARTCSAVIFAEALGLGADPGLTELLEMVTAVDNAEKLPATSLHFAIEGYPRTFKSPDGTTDWARVQERVFELFDIVYGQQSSKAQAQADLQRFARWKRFENGLRVCTIFNQPRLREAAFEAGADLVLWTQPRGKKGFYVGVQRNNRNGATFTLKGVVAQLRWGEAQVRKIPVNVEELSYVGRGEPVSNWFLHDSLNLVLSGSRTWPLENGEFTQLRPEQVEMLVHQAIAREVGNN